MFQIDVKSRKPIYEQIVDYFKEMIIAGMMKPGDKAPSVRELSKQLTINPNTIQKAYKTLESTGYFYSVAGLGSFVAELKNEEVSPVKVKKLKETIKTAVGELLFIGCPPEDIWKILEEAGLKKGGGEK